MYDVVIPPSSGVPGWSQQCHQLPSPSTTPAEAGHLLEGHATTKWQPAQRPRHTWESFSESVCFAAMYCRGPASPCGPYYAVGNVRACLSYSSVFHPSHIGPCCCPVSRHFKTGLETVFAVTYLVWLLGKTVFDSVLLCIMFFTVASKESMSPDDSCTLTSSPGESPSPQVCS